MLEGLDQASGLRRLVAAPRLALLAFPVAAGSPQPWIAQLACALRALGRKPMVLDAGRGVVAGAFGLRLRHELVDLLHGEREFDEVARPTADGVYVLRADRGVDEFVASGAPAARLLEGFARLSHGFDDLLLAMAPNELASLASPRSSVPVLGVDAAGDGVVGGYGVAKCLAEEFGYRRFACVVREARSEADARGAHARLAGAASRFLNAEVAYAGSLPVAAAAGVAADAFMRTAQALLQTAAVPLAPA
ncbi:MinD/ParA family ATP-binding protein [Ramlibacter sp.]|uniref:MinD/ParA family ATP-binding protein n=1 Tax=Ramlibacter sp. TaxID=1917967 RepID=UPI003D12E17D